jgi:hypothetical protein
MKRIDRVNQNLGGSQCPQVQDKILLKKLNNDVTCLFPPDRANEHAIMVPANYKSSVYPNSLRGKRHVKTGRETSGQQQRKISLYTSKINDFTN